MTLPTIGPLPPGVKSKAYPDGRAVLWRGAVFGPDSQNPPPDQPPYTVVIDGVTRDVPTHGWRQRATFRSQPVTIKRTAEQIVAANRSFPFGDPGGPGIEVSKIASTPAFKGPFDSSTIIKGMGQTGGGSDRWLVTDESAYFMRTGNAGPMLAKALAADSVPINDIDENTGKPVDLIKYPTLNCYNNTVPPSFATGPNGGYSDGWTPVMNHYPALSYTAFEATYDLGFLFNLQAAANFAITEQVWSSVNLSGNPHKAIVNAGETRRLAWGLRCLFEAHTATMDAEAQGIDLAAYDLHPSSYFKALLDNQLTFYTKQSQEPQRQQFRLLGPDIWPVGPWQCDYLHMTLAFGVLTGHSDWAPLFLWTLGNPIARTSGKSGWPQCYPVAYYMNTIPKGDVLETDTVPPTPRYTWAQAFDDQIDMILVQMPQAEHDAMLANPGGTLSAHDGGGGGDPTMFAGVRFALVAADHVDRLGLAGVRKMYPEFDTCLENIQGMLTNKGPGAFAERFCIVAAPSQPKPPTGDITVSDPVFNAPFTASVGFKDNHGGDIIPDTVVWSAPDAFKITQDPANIRLAHGVYGAEGPATIKAVGTKAGISVTATKEVTVPAAAPFIASGEITLS